MYMIVTRVAQSAPCLLNVANQAPMNVLHAPMEPLQIGLVGYAAKGVQETCGANGLPLEPLLSLGDISGCTF